MSAPEIMQAAGEAILGHRVDSIHFKWRDGVTITVTRDDRSRSHHFSLIALSTGGATTIRHIVAGLTLQVCR